MSSSILHSYRLSTGRSFLSFLARRRYRTRQGGRAEPTADVVPFRTAPEFEEVAQGEAESDFLMRHDSDLFCCAKPLTDVLLRGHACSTRGSALAVDTGVAVGAAQKRVRAHGDRSVVVGGDGRLAFSAAAPFDRMPLTWERAYGGRDVYAESAARARLKRFGRGRELGHSSDVLAYPRNGFGRGFALALDLQRLAGADVPNLEDPADPVTPDRMVVADADAWLDLPIAAAYGPIHQSMFPRAAFFIPPVWAPSSRPARELALGAVLQADLDGADDRLMNPDTRVMNCAPAGLAVCRLSGGERVKLWGLHPKLELLEYDLPADRPRLYLELPNVGGRELPDPLLQMVELDPDDDTVTLTWASKLEVAWPFPDELLQEMRRAVAWERSVAQ